MSPPSLPRLRPLRPDDAATLDAVLELNQRWVPHVGPLSAERLIGILGDASVALVAELPDDLDRSDVRRTAGFVIALGPGSSYDSPNYRWFEQRAADGGSSAMFRYVDRIAVSPEAQGRGVGRGLYEAVFAEARASDAGEVTCEVNVDPPNPASLAFHTCLGFVGVGRQWTYDHSVEVQLMSRTL